MGRKMWKADDLEKMKKLGFFNGIFEIDLSDGAWDWDEFTVEDLCELMQVCAILYHNPTIRGPSILFLHLTYPTQLKTWKKLYVEKRIRFFYVFMLCLPLNEYEYCL